MSWFYCNQLLELSRSTYYFFVRIQLLSTLTVIYDNRTSELTCYGNTNTSLSFVKHLLYQLLGHLEETSVNMIKKAICEFLLESCPKVVEFADLRSTYIANCVFNSILSYTCITLNIVTIHAIRKTSSLPNPLKTLLLSLAISDVVGVGFLGQPFYISLLVKWIQQNNPGCNTYMVFEVIQCVFFLASFFGVVAISVDRFLAIHLHLRYQELVTHKRVVVVVISKWVLSVFLSLTMFLIPLVVFGLVLVFVGGIGLLVTTVVYIRIYVAVKTHKNQIQAQQVRERAENREMAHFASLIKSAAGILYVYLAFLICYVPFFIYLIVCAINDPTVSLKQFYLFSWTLVYLNSSLNPVIYCWKMRHIRHAVINILRNMCAWFRNRGTHQS